MRLRTAPLTATRSVCPGLDFVALARGMGVPASRAATAEDFTDRLREAFTEPGPHPIEAVVPALF
ncbi:thiamine pyrophosphate-dependent enzyme [Streptomyces mirabilis]|uniref:thiamine pyrophosphate-dependent enzyme n=1 Tax=Streptomyces mirabilis TaxID=68239 RepID=UPI003660EF0E